MQTCAPFLTEYCRWRATRPGDILDRKLNASRMSKIGTLNVMQYIRPFTNSIQHPAAQILLTALGILQTYLSVTIIEGTKNYGIKNFRQFKIPSELANSSSGLESISLLFEGCEVFSQHTFEKNALSFSFSAPLHMDAVMLTFNISRKVAKISFTIQGSDDNWTSSFAIAASNFRFGSSNVRFLQGSVTTHQTMYFSYRPPWPWYLNVLISQLIWTLCCLGLAVSGTFNFPALGKNLTVALAFALFLSNGIAAVGFAAVGMPLEAFYPSILCSVYIAITVVLVRAEGLFADACAVLGTIVFIGTFLNELVVFNDPGNLIADPPFNGTAVMCIGAAFAVLRRQYLTRAVFAAATDAAAHDSRWRALLAAEPLALDRLDALARATAVAGPLPPRQLNRLRTVCVESSGVSVSTILSRVFHGEEDDEAGLEPGTGVAGFKLVPGAFDPSAPVTSLDQLYAQVP